MPDMTIATAGARGWMAAAVVCGGLIAADREHSKSQAASRVQSPVVHGPRLSPPWEKISRPPFPMDSFLMDWRTGGRNPFSYAAPYKAVMHEPAENIAVAPAWAIAYEHRPPRRRHKR
jgi:hypothetical protein